MFLSFSLFPMPPTLEYESRHSGLVAGIDEAGRGPWAGPVVAAAVILNATNIPIGMDDSKKLSHTKREALFDVIMTQTHTGIGIASVEEIDHLNILRATMLAMQRAVAALPVCPNIALVDGNRCPQLPCQTFSIIGGDAKSLSIAAASILAKVTRDRLMCDLTREYPHYGWEKNAGYGTVLHQKGLAQYGVTPHHRRSFAPIRTLIEHAQLQTPMAV